MWDKCESLLARNSDENFLIKSFNLDMDTVRARAKNLLIQLKDPPQTQTSIQRDFFVRVPTNRFGAFYGSDEFFLCQSVSMSSKTFASWAETRCNGPQFVATVMGDYLRA